MVCPSRWSFKHGEMQVSYRSRHNSAAPGTGRFQLFMIVILLSPQLAVTSLWRPALAADSPLG